MAEVDSATMEGFEEELARQSGQSVHDWEQNKSLIDDVKQEDDVESGRTARGVGASRLCALAFLLCK